MRKLKIIVPPVQGLIKSSPGFAKKNLADRKIDLLALCEFSCRYCSSNWGYYLRQRRKQFADLAEQQLGVRVYPDTTPELTMHFPDVVGQLRVELAGKRPGFGSGETLMFSKLTDAFSPSLVKSGVTREALELLLRHTSFRIRVLTKSAVVGSDEWLRFFAIHRDRLVVGLSIGTLNDAWSKRIEIGTSQPSSRLRAHQRLQSAGIPVFAMMCPAFAELLQDAELESLVDALRPELCEYLWAETFNERSNWRAVREGYELDSPGYRWLTEVFELKNRELWSSYALELYQRLRAKAEHGGWMSKLRFLLYESKILPHHVPGFGDLNGVLLQGKPRADGISRNSGFALIGRRATGCKDAEPHEDGGSPDDCGDEETSAELVSADFDAPDHRESRSLQRRARRYFAVLGGQHCYTR